MQTVGKINPFFYSKGTYEQKLEEYFMDEEEPADKLPHEYITPITTQTTSLKTRAYFSNSLVFEKYKKEVSLQP